MENKPIKENTIVPPESIQSMIFTIRGIQVMLDSDLAKIYQVDTKVFNQAVKRNSDRFPDRFRFQLTREEYENLRSQFVTSSSHGGRRYLPYVFTEQGIAMLSGILKSSIAVDVSIKVMDAFVEMRRFIQQNVNIFARLDSVERRQITFESETEKNFDKIFKAIEDKSINPKQGIFFDGQIFDAYSFVCDIIKQAKKSIIVIDNYVDETTLTLLSKRNQNVSATIYTKPNKKLLLDVEKHNQQYPEIKIKKLTKSHDRFIILDNNIVYHFGASLKDLGKKWFAFSKMEMGASEILKKLEK